MYHLQTTNISQRLSKNPNIQKLSHVSDIFKVFFELLRRVKIHKSYILTGDLFQ